METKTNNLCCHPIVWCAKSSSSSSNVITIDCWYGFACVLNCIEVLRFSFSFRFFLSLHRDSLRRRLSKWKKKKMDYWSKHRLIKITAAKVAISCEWRKNMTLNSIGKATYQWGRRERERDKETKDGIIQSQTTIREIMDHNVWSCSFGTINLYRKIVSLKSQASYSSENEQLYSHTHTHTHVLGILTHHETAV